MYISMPTVMRSTISVRLPHIVNELPPSRVPQLERRLQDIVAQATVATRVLLMAIGMSALVGSSLGTQIGVGMSMLLTLLMLVCEQRMELPYWLRMAGDGAVVALLVSSTGGVMSPILGVVLVLIPIGAIHGGMRDAIAATCVGILILLAVALLDMPVVSDGLATVLFVQCIAGVAVAWLSSMIQSAVICLYTGVQHQIMPMLTTQTNSARFAEWQHANLSIVETTSHDELMRMARERGYDIVGAAVDFYLAGESTPHVSNKTDCFVITSAHADEQSALVVHRNPSLLDRMQHEALAQLLVLVRMRSLMLANSERRERDQQAMQVLWRMIEREQTNDDAPLTQVAASERLVMVLGLGGMAMVAPGPNRTVESLWQTPTDSDMITQLSASQCEQISDALRRETLCFVVHERESLMVIPLYRPGESPQALVVSGAHDDADVQRMVMMFADLVMRFCVLERDAEQV